MQRFSFAVRLLRIALVLPSETPLLYFTLHKFSLTPMSSPVNPVNNLFQLINRRATVYGFLVLDHLARAPAAIAKLVGWYAEGMHQLHQLHPAFLLRFPVGKIKLPVDVQHGLKNAPAITNRVIRGENFGKQLIKVQD
jgi:NADPH-dependent curcumin reductase CurA